MQIADTFCDLGLTVFERGWLSSNNIVFQDSNGAPATVVDTGYDSHSGQTVALLRSHLDGAPIERVLNTHLHADHCGGNAALQAAWGCEVSVPEASLDAVTSWDQDRLSFRLTDQSCERFTARRGLALGETVQLAHRPWQVIAAPGHDPGAVMLFQRDSGVLITADALWEERLAIIFPELDGEPGFDDARSVLGVIEALEPRIVIPGHGGAFTDVARALSNSRKRIDLFQASPAKHLNYAARALTMFHMLERRICGGEELLRWLADTAVFRDAYALTASRGAKASGSAAQLLGRLIADGLLCVDDNDMVSVA